MENGHALRHATPKDAGAIAEVHVASWRETYAGLLPQEMLTALSVEARKRSWSRMLADLPAAQLDAVFVATSVDSVIGFGACGPQRDDGLAAQGLSGEIGSVYVRRPHQGRGLGARLMREMFAALSDAGHDAASLWVLTDNASARGFYERMGATVIGEKSERRGEITLREVAYGWRGLSASR
jgi:ribosomal protein S18 acetylase RimI-like enzyme